MTKPELIQLLAQGENHQVEFKHRFDSKALYFMCEVEKYGTGFIRIRKWLKDYPTLEYVLENLGDFTRVSLRKKVTGGDKLADNHKLILESIKNNPNISLSKLSGQVGISQTAIEKNSKKLKSLGLLKRFGSTKGGYWEVQK